VEAGGVPCEAEAGVAEVRVEGGGHAGAGGQHVEARVYPASAKRKKKGKGTTQEDGCLAMALPARGAQAQCSPSRATNPKKEQNPFLFSP